jgi:NitT/TauT family transport system substrate-binding protein
LRLKPGAKIALFLVVLTLIVVGAKQMGLLDSLVRVVAPERRADGTVAKDDFDFANADGSAPGAEPSAVAQASDIKAQDAKLNRPIRCVIVLYGGFTGGLMANGGKPANRESLYFKEYGIEVELVQIDDLVEMGNSFRVGGDKGGLDMMATTTDMFALQYDALADIKPVTIMQTDWSRGADAIAVAKGITNAQGLKGRKIAVAEGTPSHFLLLYFLAQAGMTARDITPVFTNSSIEAAQVFKAGQADACVSWSPDVYIAAAERQGASILASTREATNLLAGTIVARGDFAAQHPEAVNAFVGGWMRGVELAAQDEERAAQLLVQSFEVIKLEDAQGMLADVKLAGPADNRQFFGVDPGAAVNYDDLFFSASNIWRKVGLLKEVNRAELTRNTNFLAESTKAPPKGETVAATEEFEFEPATPEVKKQEPIVSKRISIYFDTGSATLDDNAKMVLDQAAQLAQTFGSTYIRVSGNTDSVGGRAYNVELSRKRAQAVTDFLVKEYGFPKDKFIVVGNGPDKPVADNKTEEGRAKNRRTEFEVVPQQQQ